MGDDVIAVADGDWCAGPISGRLNGIVNRFHVDKVTMRNETKTIANEDNKSG